MRRGLTLGLALLLLAGCGRGSGSRNLSGSGSRFIKPIMDKWIEAYTKEKNSGEINYQGTGSTAGIKQMSDQAVDFACTDAFLIKESSRQKIVPQESFADLGGAVGDGTPNRRRQRRVHALDAAP